MRVSARAQGAFLLHGGGSAAVSKGGNGSGVRQVPALAGDQEQKERIKSWKSVIAR